tara:strand:- start:13676 stop:15184 length:1509 start_codon:yes stop_codon:yes gene_type:complete
MENKFISNIFNKKEFNSFFKEISKVNVGFYSVGLYPASLAYNCALHNGRQNILLAPRKGRELFGAFPKSVLSEMNPFILKKIKKMGTNYDLEGNEPNTLQDLISKCSLVILSSNSNHIQNDISKAIDLRKKLKRDNVVLACLVGSFCIDGKDENPFILCEKYPNLAFFSGFHRHGALRNPVDSFTANFCHPDSFTALVGAKILNQLSPQIQVSAGVHNIECQYIKAIKNVSSIFAGFINNFHSDKPGMLPTINTVLLSQCFDQAASVSSVVRKKYPININTISLRELGYGVEMIKAQENIFGEIFEKRDHTFSQLNAVKADVLGSMSLPSEGKPTRNFQAGQVLSEMFLKLKRCPRNISEFVEWCDKFSLSEGSLEGLKSLKYWPDMYKRYGIQNNNSSMINLIYLCFYGTDFEKKDVYKVFIDPKEMTNYCQESVHDFNSIDLKFKMLGVDIFNEIDILYETITNSNSSIKDINKLSLKNLSRNEFKYLNVIKLVNKYFDN